MTVEVAPFTDDDLVWARAKETHALRDALLSDADLDAYRVAVDREVIATKARGAPDWWQTLTAIRLSVIQREVAYRHKVASLGGPEYAPGDWWARTVDAIRTRARTDLVTIMVESGLVRDDRRGRDGEVWGLCPIHHERSSSMHIDEEGGLWHCFGCGAGGDVFTWLERAHSLRFPDAVRWLAERYGVDMTPPPTPLRYRTVDA